MKSGRFHAGFMKSGGFHVKSAQNLCEIWQILCGFHMKSGRFHEIQQISCEI